MATIRGRLRRRGEVRPQDEEFIEIDPAELTKVFRAPGWLRDAGLTAWLLVGITLLLAGLIWLASLTSTIVLPVITAAVIAAVAGQLVSLLWRHRLPRGLGAVLVLLLIVAAGALATYLILAGIASETGSISDHLNGAADKVEGWLKDLGVSSGKAHNANHDASSAASDTYKALELQLGGELDVTRVKPEAVGTVTKDGPTHPGMNNPYHRVATQRIPLGSCGDSQDLLPRAGAAKPFSPLSPP